jgi:hypothetical protein
MALPKIDVPLFELMLPSTGQPVKYRPFLVKEQKILLLALEGQNFKETVTAMRQIVSNCVLSEEVDVEKLPTFDLEYIFLKLRAKSIGEEVELNLRHATGLNSKEEICDAVTIHKVNLMDVEVIKSVEHEDKFILDEKSGLGIKFKYPTPDLDMMDNVEDKSQLEIAAEAMMSSIEYIFDNENVYKKEDYTKQELNDFIDSMTQDQFAKCGKFFDTMPKLKHTVKWKCKGCGCEDEITLEGLTSFFVF